MAACAQIVNGMTSFYRWKGAIQKDDEVLILIKTREGLTRSIEKQFESLHPYDVPELITVAITSLVESVAVTPVALPYVLRIVK